MTSNIVRVVGGILLVAVMASTPALGLVSAQDELENQKWRRTIGGRMGCPGNASQLSVRGGNQTAVCVNHDIHVRRNAD